MLWALQFASAGAADAAICRMYLTNVSRPEPRDETPAQKDERVSGDRKRLGDAASNVSASPFAALFGGLNFRDETVKGPGGQDQRFQSTEVQCNPQQARQVSDGLRGMFTPKPGEDQQIQFGFEFLENPPNVRHSTLAADFLARRTAKALESLCQEAGTHCSFAGVTLDGINDAVRGHCDNPISASCTMLQEEIRKQDEKLRDAPGPAGVPEFTGSPLEGLLLPARYRRPYTEPPAPLLDGSGVVKKEPVPKAPAEDSFWNRFTNQVGSAGRHVRDIAGGYVPWSQSSAPAGVPYTGGGFKDFDPPFRDGPAPAGKAKPIKILSPFGSPRNGGRSHQGVDITCKEGEGEPIYAPQAGVVEGWFRFGNSGISGNRMWLDHGMVDGVHVETFYAHLKAGTPFAPGIRPGVQVQKGQLIAYCGTTGNAAGMRGDGIHLHYECHANGPAINPDPACFPNAEIMGRARRN